MKTWYAMSALAIVAALCSFLLAWHLYSKAPVTPILYQLATIDECIASRTRLVDKKIDDIENLRKFSEQCYTDIRNQGLLNDFQMRRGKFLYQDYANYVILWMVVAITVSGVILAGLQLAASYKLATARGVAFAVDSELSWKKSGEVALKSSITGLFILLISFAFFLVFVIRIYEIHEVNVDEKPARNLPQGNYGAAP